MGFLLWKRCISRPTVILDLYSIFIFNPLHSLFLRVSKLVKDSIFQHLSLHEFSTIIMALEVSSDRLVLSSVCASGISYSLFTFSYREQSGPHGGHITESPSEPVRGRLISWTCSIQLNCKQSTSSAFKDSYSAFHFPVSVAVSWLLPESLFSHQRTYNCLLILILQIHLQNKNKKQFLVPSWTTLHMLHICW